MAIAASEIDSIVRLVVERLRADAAEAHDLSRSVAADAVSEVKTLVLNKKLISLEDVLGKLSGVQVIQTPPRAVITPAVKDELRRLGVQLDRSGSFACPRNEDALSIAGVDPSRMLVVVPQRKCDSVRGILKNSVDCVVSETTTESQEASRLAEHCQVSGQRVVWCSERPFAATLACRQPTLRAIQLHQLADLKRALKESMANVIVVDDRQWSSHAIANLTRTWMRDGDSE